MFLEESPEQQQLRAELRRYYGELLTDEVRAGLAAGGEGGEAWAQVVRQIGKDGWLGIGWPTEFGGQGRPATDQFIFFDEDQRARRAVSRSSPSTRSARRSCATAPRSRSRSSFRRSLRASSTSPSATPSRRRARTSRRCARVPCATATSTSINGAQDLHHRRGPGRLHLAGRTHRSRGAQAQGHLDPLRPDDVARLRVTPIINTVGGAAPRRRPSTTTCASRWPTGSGDENEGWRMITTQLNHERVGLAAWSGLATSLYQDVVAWAAQQGTDDGKTLDRAGLGAARPGQVPRRARGHAAAELAHGGARRRRRAHWGGVIVDQGLRDRDASSR